MNNLNEKLSEALNIQPLEVVNPIVENNVSTELVEVKDKYKTMLIMPEKIFAI